MREFLISEDNTVVSIVKGGLRKSFNFETNEVEISNTKKNPECKGTVNFSVYEELGRRAKKDLKEVGKIYNQYQ